MPPRRRIPEVEGQDAVVAWREGERSRSVVATAVRFTLEELGIRAPGRSVEVRVPPFGAVQCVEGPVHRRGTPPNVTETDADTWLRLATGVLDWSDAEREGLLRVSGTRADLSAFLPLVGGDPAH